MDKPNNNFGFLRLLLACFVILSHSPELIDGNRNRELLHFVFGNITLGELAVDGFFLISGYLILKSYKNSSSFKTYISKRILRIYPAFAVASLVSILVFAPLSIGADFLLNSFFVQLTEWIWKVIILSLPSIKGISVFPSNHYQELNGATWTIRYEFLCYLSIPIISMLGFYRKRALYLYLTIIFIVLFLLTNIYGRNLGFDFPINTSKLIRLTSAFMVGGCFYLFADKVTFEKRLILPVLSTLFLLMFIKELAEIALILLGGYLLFYFAFKFKKFGLNNIGNKVDISYGVYLYGWPVQSLLIQKLTLNSPLLLNILTLSTTFILGYLSWMIVEKPCIELKKTFL